MYVTYYIKNHNQYSIKTPKGIYLYVTYYVKNLNQYSIKTPKGIYLYVTYYVKNLNQYSTYFVNFNVLLTVQNLEANNV